MKHFIRLIEKEDCYLLQMTRIPWNTPILEKQWIRLERIDFTNDLLENFNLDTYKSKIIALNLKNKHDLLKLFTDKRFRTPFIDNENYAKKRKNEIEIVVDNAINQFISIGFRL